MMMVNLKQVVFYSIVLVSLLLSGCGSMTETKPTAGAFLTLTDDLGRQVVLSKKPERIIPLSPSFLDLLGTVQADVIARPTSKNNVPDFATALPEVGAVYNINVEQLMAQKPDLVIAYQGMHDKLVPVLESSKIPVLVLKLKTYQDVKDKLTLFGKITERSDLSQAKAAQMDERIRQIVARMPAAGKRVAILHSTAKSVTVELESSIAGSTAKALGFVNVAAGSKATGKDPDAIPYSLEALVEQKPELIFVVTMGNLEEIKKRMLSDVESSPAWASLDAVRNKQVFFLPQDLFLLNPGIEYPQAFATMAALAYPEVFVDGR